MWEPRERHEEGSWWDEPPETMNVEIIGRKIPSEDRGVDLNMFTEYHAYHAIVDILTPPTSSWDYACYPISRANPTIFYSISSKTRDVYECFTNYLEKYFMDYNPIMKIVLTREQGNPTSYVLTARSYKGTESSVVMEGFSVDFRSTYCLDTTFWFLSEALKIGKSAIPYDFDEVINSARKITQVLLNETDLIPISLIVLDYIY